jgi:hypothetical protein
MKLSNAHAIRIASLAGLQASLADTMGDSSATAVIATLQKIATQLVQTASDDADPGRLTHAIDCLRGALEGYNHANDLHLAKKRRLQQEERDDEAARATLSDDAHKNS